MGKEIEKMYKLVLRTKPRMRNYLTVDCLTLTVAS